MLCLVVPRPPSRPLCAKSCHIFYVCFALSTTFSGWHHENLHSLSTSSSLQSMARLGLIYSKCAEIIDIYSLISSVKELCQKHKMHRNNNISQDLISSSVSELFGFIQLVSEYIMNSHGKFVVPRSLYSTQMAINSRYIERRDYDRDCLVS